MKNKGITLIVFTITMILLLILGLITIAQLIGSKVFGKEILAETLNTEITFEPNEYTNKESTNLLVIISNNKGIKSIKTPDKDTIFTKNRQSQVGIDYVVTKNANYQFVITDNEGNEESKSIDINIFDRVEPKDFIPKEVRVKANSVIIKGNAEDGEETEDSVKSGIAKYEYFVNGIKKGETTEEEFEITGLVTNTSYNIHLIAYDKAGNTKKSQVINVIPKDILYIYNLEELKEFRDNVNNGNSYKGTTVQLMSDIDLECNENDQSTWWISIGDVSKAFMGTFEGNGHKISNLKMYSTETNNNNIYGFFGKVASGGSIKNLIIDNGIISGFGQNAGLLAGMLQEGVTIENCLTLGGSVELKKSSDTYGGCAGGLIGSTWKDNIINQCKNSAFVTSRGDSGGIVGMNKVGNLTITQCANYGRIETSACAAAGILGRTGDKQAVEISNSYNSGEINSYIVSPGMSGYSSSGITSFLMTEYSSIINCYNRGKLTRNPNMMYVGGILNECQQGVLNNNYYLSGMGADYGIYSTKKNNNYARPKTEIELKNLTSTLGSAYIEDTNNINDGYPILHWEINE